MIDVGEANTELAKILVFYSFQGIFELFWKDPDVYTDVALAWYIDNQCMNNDRKRIHVNVRIDNCKYLEKCCTCSKHPPKDFWNDLKEFWKIDLGKANMEGMKLGLRFFRIFKGSYDYFGRFLTISKWFWNRVVKILILLTLSFTWYEDNQCMNSNDTKRIYVNLRVKDREYFL